MNVDASTAAIELLSAGKTYADGTRGLAATDLRIDKGEFVSLLGPSGCGKSTLLKMIAGLLATTEGRVQLAPDTTTGDDPRLAFVFQSPTLMPWASVQANVRLPLDLQGVPRAEADPRVAETLQLVGLQTVAAALPRTLSGGMQMRVSIARGLVVRPTLLLMDEPFGALDEITRQRLDGELLALWAAQQLTVVFVTHSIHEAVFLSSRIVMMAAQPGRIVDEIVIDEPYPRTREFIVTPRFAVHAKRVQDSLLRASGEIAFESELEQSTASESTRA